MIKGNMLRKISAQDVNIVEKSLTLKPHQSATDLHKALKRDGADLCLNTVRKAIRAASYTYENPWYAHMVKDANKGPRVVFCRQLIDANNPMNDIIFSDESSIQLHNNKVTVYSLTGTCSATNPKP
ncbi:hypothetical protein DPMN_175789 [Dreissena polymorpha]|uniref:Transposase n=1 Tax=Dreissena polymorpha TaxID=45954 RepID=A0A9D4EA19_DREPO|nr:hypothetical protein DPMN_175789 [Dreissena polymorpha]